MTTEEKLERLWKIRSMEPGCVPIGEMSWLLDELQARLEWEKYINGAMRAVVGNADAGNLLEKLRAEVERKS